MNSGHSDDFKNNDFRAERRLNQAILDTLPAHIAIVDENGSITVANKAWKDFAATNGKPDLASFDVGANYLEVAKRAIGPYADDKRAAFLGIIGVLDGATPHFSLEYPCDSLAEKR